VGIRIPAGINRCLRTTAAWAEDRDIGTDSLRRGAVLCALIVVYATLSGSRALGRLVHGRRAIVVLGLAAAIPVLALEYRSYPGGRTTDVPVAAARVAENGPAGEGINESLEENARMTRWKRSVEQALKEAEARAQATQEDAAKEESAKAQMAAEAPKQADLALQDETGPPIDLGIVQEVVRLQDEAAERRNQTGGSHVAKAADDAKPTNKPQPTKESGPASSGSSAVGGDGTNPTNGAAGASPFSGAIPFADAVPFAFTEEQPPLRLHGHFGGRGHWHWRGRHHGWAFARLRRFFR
jgi:hypothetical protein